MSGGQLDDKDEQILELLKDNARMGYTEIGKAVGLSRVAVKNRIESMERCGIIKGYRTVIDNNNMSGNIRFYIDIETLPDSYEYVVEILAYNEAIKQIYTTTGACKVHAEGYVISMEELSKFINMLLRLRKGVVNLNWDVLSGIIKDEENGINYKRYRVPEYVEKIKEERGIEVK